MNEYDGAGLGTFLHFYSLHDDTYSLECYYYDHKPTVEDTVSLDMLFRGLFIAFNANNLFLMRI